MVGETCPFCSEIMQGHMCAKCGAYDVVDGHNNDKYKDQPYNIEGYD